MTCERANVRMWKCEKCGNMKMAARQMHSHISKFAHFHIKNCFPGYCVLRLICSDAVVPVTTSR
jgi:argininosuccinate lyase